MKPRSTAYLLLLATVLIWGATFTLVKTALRDASPLLFNFVRFTLAAAILIVANRRAIRHLNRSQIEAGLMAGFFLALGYELQTLGLTRTGPIQSAFITGMVVILVPAMTMIPAFRPLGTTLPGLPAFGGALLAFSGLILLTTPPGVGLQHLYANVGRGDLLTLLGAFAFAAHVLTLARASQRMQAGPLATVQIGFAALVMLALTPLEHVRLVVTPGLVFALLVCSLFATAAAFTVQSFAQRVLPPTHIVILLTLEPVFAWLTSVLILHQGLDRRSMEGGLLILAGIAFVEWRAATPRPEIPG